NPAGPEASSPLTATPERYSIECPTRRACSTSTTVRRRSGHRLSKRAAATGPHGSDNLRSTFASDSVAAGVTVFELARAIGTSVRMIERHSGTLLGGTGASIAAR